MGAISAVLVGAGLRGRQVYAAWAQRHPDRLRIDAIAEPDTGRRQVIASEHGLSADAVASDWRELLGRKRFADAAIVATPDTEHVGPALAALDAGYHVLLEKPIAPTPQECIRVVEAAERADRILQIGHVLRYTDFYLAAQEILQTGRIGRPIHMDLREHVAHWHMAHSYVRGKFRNEDVAAPFLLAKSCHDLDLLAWLADTPALRLSSFGSVGHFAEKNAPPGGPAFCLDDCPIQVRCAHDAEAFYLGPDEAIARSWPWSDVSADPSRAARRLALKSGPYGRCVYRCDNDVVDHQVVSVEFQDGMTATLGVHGLATHETRTLRISGSEGELRGRLDEGLLSISRQGSLEVEERVLEGSALGHHGGDHGLIDHFVRAVQTGDATTVRASGRVALESHLMGFAAEQARRERRVIDLERFACAVRPAEKPPAGPASPRGSRP